MNKNTFLCIFYDFSREQSRYWCKRQSPLSSKLMRAGCCWTLGCFCPSVRPREVRLQPAAGCSRSPHLPGEMQSSPRVRRRAGWQHVLCRQHERRRRLLPGLCKKEDSMFFFFSEGWLWRERKLVKNLLCLRRVTPAALWYASVTAPTTLSAWWAGETAAARSTSRASMPMWADLSTGSLVIWSLEDVRRANNISDLQTPQTLNCPCSFNREESESFLTPSPKQHIILFAYAGVICINSHSICPEVHMYVWAYICSSTVNKDSDNIQIPTLLASGRNLCSQPVHGWHSPQKHPKQITLETNKSCYLLLFKGFGGRQNKTFTQPWPLASHLSIPDCVVVWASPVMTVSVSARRLRLGKPVVLEHLWVILRCWQGIWWNNRRHNTGEWIQRCCNREGADSGVWLRETSVFGRCEVFAVCCLLMYMGSR